MPKYSLSLKSSAAKELKKLPLKVQHRIVDMITKLIDDPRYSGVVKLKGNDNLYRCRVGEYRIVYEINDSEQKIVITRIRHRRDVYR
ncbi:MAG: type II toxin-antitoxin system RelE/ParE family toxin [Cyanobacteria bacterium P01_G01_bin.67]